MKGFVRQNGRPTKGDSLPGKVGARSAPSEGAKQRAEETPPEPNGKSSGNGAISSNNDGLSSVPRDAIVELVSAESGASSGLADRTRELSKRSDRSTPPPSRFLRPNPQLTSDRAELSGAESFRIPRWKRILDFACIFLTVPIWLPLMILLMLWIKITSPGPVCYRQERVGYRRDRFMIFKFRTMHVNAETRTHEEYFASLMRLDCPMTKLDEGTDSRLTRGGRFLRASGLDELPQIFNVLRGEMSLVGPRPCLPHEFKGYKVWQQRRVSAPPGLTGYWQVNGKNKTTFNEMITMDLSYADNMSLWLDLTIILKTIPALVGQMLESGRTSRFAVPTQVAGQTWAVTEGLNGTVREI